MRSHDAEQEESWAADLSGPWRYYLRQAAPLLPAWGIGVFLLLTSSRIWVSVMTPTPYSEANHSTPAWTLIGSLCVASVLYALAPRLGPYLCTVVPSSAPRTLNPCWSSGGLGTGVLRGLAILGAYVVVCSMLIDA
jgi:hypothetical protein